MSLMSHPGCASSEAAGPRWVSYLWGLCLRLGENDPTSAAAEPATVLWCCPSTFYTRPRPFTNLGTGPYPGPLPYLDDRPRMTRRVVEEEQEEGVELWGGGG